MSEYKFTKDGRKVVVRGKLNSEEFIVQEIFVSDGQEVPGGENFTAKGLLDKPSVSWKEKNLAEIESSYDRRKQDLEEARKRLDIQIKKTSKLAGAFSKLSENFDVEALERLSDFVQGRITHYAFPNYHPEIREVIDSKNFQQDHSLRGTEIEALKLITLFGKTDGDLEFRINRWSDGSGMDTQMIPCRSREEALKVMQRELDAASERYLSGEIKGFNLDEWSKIQGLVIPSEVLNKRKLEKIAGLEKEIANCSKKLKSKTRELATLKGEEGA